MSEKERLWNRDRKEFVRRVIRKEGAPVRERKPVNCMPFEIESVSESARGRIADLVRVADLAFKTQADSPGKALITHMKSLKEGAASRDLEFSLSDAEMSEMMDLACHYCGIRERHRYSGIDRVDNSLGYTQSNCVPCCRWCNYAKGVRRVDDFVAWLRWVAWESPLSCSAPQQPAPAKLKGRLRSRDHVKMVPLNRSVELSVVVSP